jgi:hypothetical protein
VVSTQSTTRYYIGIFFFFFFFERVIKEIYCKDYDSGIYLELAAFLDDYLL